MTSTAVHAPRVLADVIPGRLLRDAVLVASSAVFVGVAAQGAIPLPFTPVPLSLATLAVLVSGAALGATRAGLGMLTYLLAGMAGVPWFSDQVSGWAFASFGYIVGFVLAGVIVGALARRGADRTVGRTAGLMVVGNLVIYAFGLPWLMAFLDVGLAAGLRLGVVPFLIGDGLKILIGAALLPGAWWLVHRVEGRG